MKKGFLSAFLILLFINVAPLYGFPFWFNYQVKIGCLVPLDGDEKIMGQMVLKGLSLGLESLTKDTFCLRVYNSASDADYASSQIIRMKNDGCKVGVVFVGQKTAQAVIQKAREVGLPLVVMSPDDNLPLAPNIYQDFVTLKIQIENLVKYAVQTLGFRSFVILYPQNSFGRQAMLYFSSYAQSQGGIISKVIDYPPNSSDFSHIIKEILGPAIAEAKPEEFISHPPRLPFDAIFIPDTPLTSTFIISQFAYYNASNISYLGTSLWKNYRFLDNIKKYCQAVYYPVGFSAKARQPWVRSFIEHYAEGFHQRPSYLVAQSYEIGQILSYLQQVANLDMGQAPNYIQNFPGVTGITTLLPTGELIKRIWIVQQDKHGLSVNLCP